MTKQIQAYKAFNSDWTCKGHKFTVGGTYKIAGEISLCYRGFHACTNLADCFKYYPFSSKTKVAHVVCSGDINYSSGDSKIACSQIKIAGEIPWSDVLKLCNSGDRNTGNWNSGNWNTGIKNSGNWNTGIRNSGNWNTGSWNSCNRETGFFNSAPPATIRVFNAPCDLDVWERAAKPDFIYFDLCKWIQPGEMTTDEKAAHPEHKTTGGYLKPLSHKEAWREAWDGATDEDKQLLYALPNFDWSVFTEISGIEKDES